MAKRARTRGRGFGAVVSIIAGLFNYDFSNANNSMYIGML